MSDHPLQRIRRSYEQLVEDALNNGANLSIPVFSDNEYYAEKKAVDEFALVRLSFGEMHQISIGGMDEDIRGSLIVEIYVAKGKGSGRAQDAGTAVLIALAGLNTRMSDPFDDVVSRTGPISGPRLTPLQSAPHFQCRLSCSIRARYDMAQADFLVLLLEDETPFYFELATYGEAEAPIFLET